MAITAAQLMVKVGADTADAERGLQSVKDRLSSFGKQAAITGGLLSLGVTAPLAGVAKTALDTAMSYEKSLNIFQAVSGATSDQMQRVAVRAKDLGADLSLPATSAADAAQAMTELAKAGLSVNDSLSAAKGVLQLAAAGNLSEAQAAEIAANALNAFHLQGSEATRVADLLAAAANASSGEVTDMADSLKMSAAVFASAGIPIEELVAAIGQMANAGIKGSDAGTSLKQMLLSLQAPSDKAADLMAGLGIDIYDAQGKMLPFGSIIEQFSSKLGGLTQEQRNQALATIFGSDAVRAANIVMMGGVQAHQQMLNAVTREGAAADLAGARMKGLAGALEGLKSQVETVLLDAAEPFLGFLEELARGLADLVPKITELDPNIRNAALAFGAVLAAAGPAILMFGALATAIGFLLSPIGLVVLALAAFAAAYAGNFLGIRDLTNQVIGQVVPLIVGGFQQVVGWVQANWPLIQQTIETVLVTVQTVIQTVLGIVQRVWAEHGDAILAKATTIWNGILAAIQIVLQTVVPFVLEQLSIIIMWVQANWPLIQQTIETVLNAILAVVTFILDQILVFWEAHGQETMAIVSSIWTIISTIISTAIYAILGILRVVMQMINGDWSGAWETIKDVVSRIWESIKTIVSAAVNILANILSIAWAGIKSGVEKQWNDVLSAITGIWDSIVGVIKGRINTIIGQINKMIDAWNSLGFHVPGFDVELPSAEVPGVGRVGGGHLAWGGIDVSPNKLGHIAPLATGGIVTSPTLALVGEAGPEAVLPLNRLDALAERIATAVARRPTYTINASYRYQDERSLRDDLRLLQLLGATT